MTIDRGGEGRRWDDHGPRKEAWVYFDVDGDNIGPTRKWSQRRRRIRRTQMHGKLG